MGRSVITAAEVHAASGDRLVVPADAIVTPLARDVAKDRGVSIVRGGAAEEAPRADDALMTQIRTIVTSMLGSGGGALAASTARPRVKLARQADARLEPFPYPGPPPSMAVTAGDVVTVDDGAPMAAGYLTLTKGSFPWTLTYDEIQIVLEGELHLGGDGGGQIGRPGDILYVPKGSSITFGTPSWAKFIYVTFPANWEEGL
ncbi:cupin domain-containing protein [Tessaracoccus sp. Y36]